MLRLRALTSRLCDGELTGEESVELATLLDGNPAATAEYLAYTSLHLDLGQRLRSYHDSTAPSQNDARDKSHQPPTIAATPRRARTRQVESFIGRRWRQLPPPCWSRRHF